MGAWLFHRPTVGNRAESEVVAPTDGEAFALWAEGRIKLFATEIVPEVGEKLEAPS